MLGRRLAKTDIVTVEILDAKLPNAIRLVVETIVDPRTAGGELSNQRLAEFDGASGNFQSPRAWRADKKHRSKTERQRHALNALSNSVCSKGDNGIHLCRVPCGQPAGDQGDRDHDHGYTYNHPRIVRRTPSSNTDNQ